MQQGHHIWRVEFEACRNRGLRTWGIATYQDFCQKAGSIWSYLVGDGNLPGWFSVRLPMPDSPRSKWPLHPIWQVVQAQGPAWGPSGRLTRSVVLSSDPRRGIANANGIVKNYAARHRVSDQKTAIAMFVQELLSLNNPEDWSREVAALMTHVPPSSVPPALPAGETTAG